MSIVEDIVEDIFDKERAAYKKRIEELEEFRTKAIARIHRLSDALEEIMFRNEGSEDEHCECVDDDRFPQHNYVCNYHIAKRALEGKP